MSTKEFIPYITTLLAEKMGAALGKAVYVGKVNQEAQIRLKHNLKV